MIFGSTDIVEAIMGDSFVSDHGWLVWLVILASAGGGTLRWEGM